MKKGGGSVISIITLLTVTSAQSISPPSWVSTSPSVSTSTTYIDVFDTSCSDYDLVTDYATVTVTTCPQCTEKPVPITQHTTVYTTTFSSLCETGWVEKPHVITETCTGETPTWSSGSGYVPPGFTETVTVCTVCGKKPTKVTLTVPCEETGVTNEKPGSPPAAPAIPTGPNNPPPITGVWSSDAAPPYPTGSNSTLYTCPGSPYCKSTATQGAPGGNLGSQPSPGGSNKTPPNEQNSASIVSFGWMHMMILAVNMTLLGTIMVL